MTDKDFRGALARLGSEPKFRARMKKNMSATLKDEGYDKLTDDDRKALKNVVDGFAADCRQAKRPWWPTSFKEVGGAGLSLVLIILLFIVACKTFGMMDAQPQVVTVGNTTQVVDTYARSKDLLSTLFPLFAAVVTFWLGVAVEGKRADDNRDTADRETENAKKAGNTLSEAKGYAEGRLKEYREKVATAPSPFGSEVVQSLEDIVKHLG